MLLLFRGGMGEKACKLNLKVAFLLTPLPPSLETWLRLRRRAQPKTTSLSRIFLRAVVMVVLAFSLSPFFTRSYVTSPLRTCFCNSLSLRALPAHLLRQVCRSNQLQEPGRNAPIPSCLPGDCLQIIVYTALRM